MSFEALVALGVLAILVTLVVGIVLWARSAPPYDDGVGGSFVTYLPEPDDPRRLPAAPRANGDPVAGDDAGKDRPGA